MSKQKDTFAKQIFLPKALKMQLKIQAIKEGYGSLANMIQSKIVAGLKDIQD